MASQQPSANVMNMEADSGQQSTQQEDQVNRLRGGGNTCIDCLAYNPSSLTLAHELVPFYAVLQPKTSWRAAAASTVSAVVATVLVPLPLYRNTF
jgi:hypothetical protein